jgi:hypothetical protein
MLNEKTLIRGLQIFSALLLICHLTNHRGLSSVGGITPVLMIVDIKKKKYYSPYKSD